MESVLRSKMLPVAALSATDSYYSSARGWRPVLASLLPLHRLWQQSIGIKSRKRGDIEINMSSCSSFHGFVRNMENQCRI